MMAPRTPGHLSPFAAALVDDLRAAGWSFYPADGQCKDDESGAVVLFQPGFRALVRLRSGAVVRPYSRRAGAAAAAHEVAAKVLAAATLSLRRPPTELPS